MITSQETNNILKAMIEAAPEVSSICKTKQAYGYKYATLDSLIDMLRGVLPKHGIWFMQMPTRVEDKSTLTTRIFHTSGEWIEDSIDMTDTELQGKANDTQKLGASITYFRRYALSSIFGVASDDDIDGNVNNRKAPEPPRQNAKPAPTPSQQPPQQQKKMDPVQYVTDDYVKRIAEGETKDSILKDYADTLKTDAIRAVDNIPPDECRVLAIAIYNRSQAKK